MTFKEIEERKAELQAKIAEAKNQEELEELRTQVEAINKEVPEQEEKVQDDKEQEDKSGDISKEEERKLIADTQELEQRNKDVSKLKKIGGNEEMEKEERKFTIESPEYRSAWAKTLMGKKLDETEERAIGDAIGTTATTFVEATAEANGINNLGLLIPTSVRKELLERAEKESPIFRDIRKLQVDGIIDLPYLFAADDAEWVAETVDTKNEGQEYKGLRLTGHELAKDVVITWKAEAMTVDGFIDFIIDELYEKMYKAKVKAIIYGNGEGKPTGITNGLNAATDESPIEAMKKVRKGMSSDAKRGAKTYISTSVAEDIEFYKDENGNYPYLVSGVNGTKSGKIEEDPFLNDGDFVVGNMRNYIFNENAPISVAKEVTVKGRKVTYGAYQIADGMPRPNYFGYGKVQASGSGV